MKCLTTIFLMVCLLTSFNAEKLCAGASSDAHEPACTANGNWVVAPGDGNTVIPPSVTEHSVVIRGNTISYTATAAYLPIKDDKQKTLANMFYIAYTVADGRSRSERPIMFVFNGGPGSSAIWLHMGAMGPKRVLLPEEGTTMPAEYKLVDNEFTWLEFTDLVFIDPIGTGYSRAAKGVDAGQFFNIEQDVESVGKMIRLYVTQNERWLSPKYLAGESYGTTRAVSLVGYLQDDCAMMLNGLVLISMVLDFETISFDHAGDLAYALIIPSYTAVAGYHDKLTGPRSDELQKDMKEARQWAVNDYLLALAQGNQLAEQAREEIIVKLAGYTGLSESYVVNSRMRIAPYRFTKELLRDENYIIGLLDGRVKCPDTSGVGEYASVDPSLFYVKGPFVAVFNDYVRRELNFETDLPYKFLSEKVNRSWKWNEHQQGYTYVSHTLSEALNLNEHLRVFVASGYYDLTTPWLAQTYTIEHLAIPASSQNRVCQSVYESGHQIYTSLTALKKLAADVARFIVHRDDVQTRSGHAIMNIAGEACLLPGIEQE